ncbi:MAG: oligosaccharide repeat unit polymerase [Paludibacteraceae bacterium]|nr:oligosaccharide repeat unit polymerase [Paludibacteraceae bacterium]MBR4814154.1 oligosaccharide repeat unit polymerase [Paludibacteraceae bacterium]
MVYVIIVVCLFFVFGGLYCSKNNPFAPSVITPMLWMCCMLLYLTVDHRLPTLSTAFCVTLLCWIASITISSLLTQSVTYKQDQYNDVGFFVRNVYLVLAIIAFPSLIRFAQIAIVNGSSGNWALDLRLAALGRGSGFEEPYGGWQIVIWPVSYMLELLCFKKKTWWRFAIPLTIYFLFGVVTMSKMVFLSIFLYTGSILFFKKVIRLKHFVMAMVPLAILFISLQMVRHSSQFSAVSSDFIRTYILGNMSAFDTLRPCSAEHFGENTFRLFYAVLYKLGLSSTEPVDVILPWIEKPLVTNTYTGMYPFYVDFGVAGVIIFAIILGGIYGWTFKKAQCGSNFNILVYAVFSQIVFTQYVADMLFSNTAIYVKMILLLLIPFYVTKNNLLVCKEKVVSIIKL